MIATTRTMGSMVAGAITVLLLTASNGIAGPVREITSCGVTLAPGESGLLIADLDCLPGEDAIRLTRGTVRLDGHHIAGARFAISGGERGTVTILGPGEIRSSGDAILTAKTLRIENVTVRDNAAGMYVLGNLKARNLVVTNNSDFGINTDGKLTGDGITSTDNHIGIKAEHGVSAKNVTVTGNRGTGLAVLEGNVRLANATLTGNAFGEDGWDLLSPRFPRLTGTTCDHSVALLADGSAGAPWGVCASD